MVDIHWFYRFPKRQFSLLFYGYLQLMLPFVSFAYFTERKSMQLL